MTAPEEKAVLPIIVALLFVIAPAAPQPVEIPLNEIWGYHVAGTKPIVSGREPRLLDQEQFDSLRVGKTLMAAVHAGPAFIINGGPKQAIKGVPLVLGGTYQPKHSFTEGDLCLVVCAYASNDHFILDKVERAPRRIRVSWHLKRTGEEMSFPYLVLIPLPNCEPGEYDVDMNRTGEPKFGPDWWVSKSTSFQVLEKEKPARRPPPGFAPNFSGKSL
jgi:hypothetical protein